MRETISVWLRCQHCQHLLQLFETAPFVIELSFIYTGTGGVVVLSSTDAQMTWVRFSSATSFPLTPPRLVSKMGTSVKGKFVQRYQR